MNIPETSMERIVIIGGGFGGLELAKSIKNKGFQVVLIDKHNYHTFQPLLYQVATAGLEPDSIAYPIRKIFNRFSDFYFRNAQVETLLSEANVIVTNIGSLHYDHLIIATGSKTNFFGMERLERLAMPMKTVPEALNLRSLILQNFERSLLTQDLEERESLMNFVIVGAGPTGVELAGALAELKSHVLPKDYPDLDLRRMNIHLIEAAPRVLAPMSEQASAKAHKFLLKLGVNVWLDTRVTDYDGINVENTADKKMLAQTLIWAAGVEANSLNGINDEASGAGNRILVDELNRVKGHENVYAIGDVAAQLSDEYPQGHPMLAQVAMQQGKLLGKNLVRDTAEKPWKPFAYKDKGTMATIGRNKAVVDMGRIKFSGFFAWVVWMFIHLYSLVGFRNKLVTFMNWAWGYVNFDRGIRLIIRPFERPELTDEVSKTQPEKIAE
jgi:NADH dehydrogenase